MQYTFPVVLDKRTVWVSLRGNDDSYSTKDKEVQEAIEGCSYFKRGQIVLSAGMADKVADETGGSAAIVEPKEFPEVVDINGAKDILKAEPYNILPQSLRTPESVLKKAAEVGVSFPNWKLEG